MDSIRSKQTEPFIITLTGDLGSGKSSLAKRLCAAYGAEYYSTGSAQRKLAQSMNVTTLDLNKMAETDPSIDEKIDSIFISLAKTDTNLVVDSRLAWHFIPISYKIKLTVDPKEGARRILGDEQRTMEGYTSMDEALDMIFKRKDSERKRFMKYYGIDTEDNDNLDLIVNTSDLSHEAVFDAVMDGIKKSNAA